MTSKRFDLLNTMCTIHAPSGNEDRMRDFLLQYINENKSSWKVEPEIFQGNGFQNCIVLVFGKPRTAVFAHIDNIGFMARYDNELIRIGSPRVASGYKIHGTDKSGEIVCTVTVDEEKDSIHAAFERNIMPGTDFSFDCDFRLTDEYIQSCYLDNRLGVYAALKLAETLEDGAIVFSCWEEHGGGSVGFITGFLYSKFNIAQALVCDITWITSGVKFGNGVVVSVKDTGIPRRHYVNRIMEILEKNKINYQVEVEASGGSDGNEIQKSPYPVDWCFVGAPEENAHTPDEKVHIADIDSMITAYRILMQAL